MRKLRIVALLGALLVVPVSSSAETAPDQPAPPSGPRETDNTVIHEFLQKIVGEFEGEPGHWTFSYNGVGMVLVTDEEYGRMRVVAPIADASELEKEHLLVLLEANFNRALDARYALYRGQVWSIYIHPLPNLTKDQLISALRQVAALGHTYGTTFTSMDISFTGSPESEEP